MNCIDHMKKRYAITIHNDIDDYEQYLGSDSIEEAIEIADSYTGENEHSYIDDNWTLYGLTIWHSDWEENNAYLDYYIDNNEIHWFEKVGHELVVNYYGDFIEYEAVVALMGEDLREQARRYAETDSKQLLFDMYADLHQNKFGEPWPPATEGGGF